MANPSTTLENALIAALAPMLKINGGYLRAVERYNGELGGDDLDDVKRRLSGRCPGVLVAAHAARYATRNIQRLRFDKAISVDVWMVSNHLRSREARMAGDVVSAADATADPGLQQIEHDIQQLISGSDLDVDGAGPWIPQQVDVVVQADDLCIYRAVYLVDADANVKPRDNDDDGQYTSVEVEIHDTEVGDVDEAPNPVAEAVTDLTES